MAVVPPPALAPAHRRAALLAGLVLAGSGLVLTIGVARQQSAERSAAIAAYDLDQAFDLAGAVVPAEIDSFYFFVLEPEALGESNELAEKLVQAAHERDFLGIAGADADHNRAVLRSALAGLGPGRLAGLVLIYVGPLDHQSELQSLVDATGAELRFVVYRPGRDETI